MSCLQELQSKGGKEPASVSGILHRLNRLKRVPRKAQEDSCLTVSSRTPRHVLLLQTYEYFSRPPSKFSLLVYHSIATICRTLTYPPSVRSHHHSLEPHSTSDTEYKTEERIKEVKWETPDPPWQGKQNSHGDSFSERAH